MLLEWRMENYFSFRDEMVFSMLLDTFDDEGELGPEEVSLTSTIYGANASGKSNVLKGIKTLVQAVTDPESDWLQQVEPFHLDESSEQSDTKLELSLLLNNKIIRYGFHTNRREITREYLLEEEPEEKVVYESDQPRKQLYISENTDSFTEVIEAVKNLTVLLQEPSHSFHLSKSLLQNETDKANLLTLIQVADPSIVDIQMVDDDIRVVKLKKRMDGSYVPIEKGFRFQDVESTGTIKLFAMAGVFAEVLQEGGVLLIDEMDQSFHPLLTRYVLELFRSERNRNRAQLIYSTHNVTNLQADLFRREEVWFVEKKKDGSSELFSLAEYEEEERSSFSRDYLYGRYGAIPFVPPAEWRLTDDEK